MKKILVILYIVLSGAFVFAQSFEGEIVYKNTYKSKVPKVTDKKFSDLMGSQQNYYIKDGDYKSETNGTLMFWQLYINADNKLYSKFANSVPILWNDGSVNTDAVISAELHYNAATILGYQCDELIFNCKSGVQKYFFTSRLPVDSKLYAKHQYGNWYAYLSKANALPLKIVIDNTQFTMESTATAIKPIKLDKKMFQLPVGAKTAKSPY